MRAPPRDVAGDDGLAACAEAWPSRGEDVVHVSAVMWSRVSSCTVCRAVASRLRVCARGGGRLVLLALRRQRGEHERDVAVGADRLTLTCGVRRSVSREPRRVRCVAHDRVGLLCEKRVSAIVRWEWTGSDVVACRVALR